MFRDPIFLDVPFGSIRAWDRNPRAITKDSLEELAKRIKEKGLFRNLVCWPFSKRGFPKEDSGLYETGGGNMRFLAMRDVLRFPSDRLIHISLNFPESEKERIELSVLDNMLFGYYEEQKVAEFWYPFKSKIDFSRLKLHFSNPIALDYFLNSFGPEGTEIEEILESDRRSIRILCSSDDEFIELRELLGISSKKKSEIKASALKELLR